MLPPTLLALLRNWYRFARTQNRIRLVTYRAIEEVELGSLFQRECCRNIDLNRLLSVQTLKTT